MGGEDVLEEAAVHVVDRDFPLDLSELEEGMVTYGGVYVACDVGADALDEGQLVLV